MSKAKFITFFFSILCCPGLRAQQLEYVIPTDNPYLSIGNYSEGLARVELPGDTIGYINTSGKLVFKDVFQDAGEFHCGLAWVLKEINDENYYGFIDTKGKLVIPFIYDKVENFSDNRSLVDQDKNWKVIDKTGQTIIDGSMLIQGGNDFRPPTFHDGLLVTCINNQFGYIGLSGKMLIPEQFDMATSFSEDRAIVAKEVIDTSVNEMIKSVDVLDSLYNSKPGERIKEYVYMIINTQGTVVATLNKDLEPDMNSHFSDGMFPVYNDRKKGFINKNGKVIIPPQYDGAYTLNYSDGVFMTQVFDDSKTPMTGNLIIIDTTGKEILRMPDATR